MPLSKGAMGWFIEKTLAKPENAKSPMLNLTTMADLKGLLFATVITDAIDPPISDGKMLADKLKGAGVQTTYKNYEGVTHEFFGMGAVVTDAEAANELEAHDCGKLSPKPNRKSSPDLAAALSDLTWGASQSLDNWADGLHQQPFAITGLVNSPGRKH